jgi:hypothetical protein
MTAVASGDSTVVFIRKKVRRLTASASENSLSTADIDQYINNFYNNDFPYGIKIDQMRSVYTFFTEPYRDRYPLDVNFNQGVRAPLHVEGILGTFFKDRTQFFNLWPKWPTLFQPISGDGVTTSFTFTIAAPFLSKEVVLGGVDVNGNPISVNDDGNGNLLLQIPNPVVTIPPYNTNAIPPIPGMHNQNTGNPGLNYQGSQPLTAPFFTNAIGNVNYQTGLFNINFPVAPAAGMNMTLWVAQYQTGRPYCLLFWNNEFTIRPVPKLIHKIEIETFLTPVQFIESTDSPILNQWAQYIAYGAAREILRDRQDLEGVANLEEGFMRQEGLVLERQGIEEIGQPNYQLFNSTQGYSVYGGSGGWGGYP